MWKQNNMLKAVSVFAIVINVFWTTLADSDITCWKYPASSGLVVSYSNDNKVNSTANFRCSSGLTLIGSNSSVCQHNGSWSNLWPICEDSQGCRLNELASLNLLIEPAKESYHFGDVIELFCSPGHKLIGSIQRVICLGDSWSHDLPVCAEDVRSRPHDIEEPNPCSGEPPSIENGYPVIPNRHHGASIWYKCNQDYIILNKGDVKCDNGIWKGSTAVCGDSTCKVPFLEHGEIGRYQTVRVSDDYGLRDIWRFFAFQAGDTVKHSETVIVRCNSGFIPKGLATTSEDGLMEVLCNDGVWGKLMQCEARQCSEEPPSIENGYPVISNRHHGAIIWYKCNPGYKRVKTGDVKCNYGIWKGPTPVCGDKTCNQEPPPMTNGKPTLFKREHGSRVDYECNDNLDLIGNSSVRCEAGEWIGQPPFCEKRSISFSDTPKVQHAPEGENGIVICNIRSDAHPVVTWYFKGRQIKKSPKYQILDNHSLKIHNLSRNDAGDYKCKALLITSLSTQMKDFDIKLHVQYSPEIIGDQRINFYAKLGTVVRLPCNVTAEPDPMFEWLRDEMIIYNGTSRYTMFDTSNSSSLQFAFESEDQLGEYICRANNALGQEEVIVVLKEGDGCSVPRLYNGDVIQETLGDYYWSWGKFRYERELITTKIPFGRRVSPARSYLLSCHNGFSFQGMQIRKRGITCTKGQWIPDPVCLRVGTRYNPPTSRRVVSTTLKEALLRTSPAVPSIQTTQTTPTFEVPTTTRKPFVEDSSEEKLDEVTSSASPKVLDCSCEYPISDEKLVAFVDGKRLQFLDKVPDGTQVVFRCKHVGFHRFHGPHENKCENCGSWHTTVFPTCSEPRSGNAVIIFDDKLNISEEGNLEVRKGQSVRLICVALESTLYPSWSAPSEDGIIITPERKERETYGDILYVSHLEIEDTDFKNKGRYECGVGDNAVTVVHLTVIDPNIRCHPFQIQDSISVLYEMDRRMNSKALFSCSNPRQEIVGKASLTCLRNGDWSDPPPYCRNAVTCAVFEDSPDLVISYSDNVQIGSIASFQCQLPSILLGSAFATCSENGTWSHPLPKCEAPSCSIDALMSSLPEGVLADMRTIAEEFPVSVEYGTSIPLLCEEGLFRIGSSTAKCERWGRWEFGNVQCVTGCKLNHDASPNLLFEPVQEFYLLGDVISLWCPPGQDLTSSVVRVMCLGSSWSHEIPNCMETKAYARGNFRV